MMERRWILQLAVVVALLLLAGWQALEINRLGDRISDLDARLIEAELAMLELSRGTHPALEHIEEAVIRETRQRRRARRARRVRASAGESRVIDTRKPRTPRDEETVKFLREIEEDVQTWASSRGIPVQDADQVVAVFEEFTDQSRATREHLATGQLSHSDAREQLREIRTEAQDKLVELLGEEAARDLQVGLTTGAASLEP